MVEKIEKWKDGTMRMVYRDEKGHFTKSSSGKFRNTQIVGAWHKEPQQKIVPEIPHKDYVKGDYYRASVSINIPWHGTRQKPNYKNFTYVIVDEKDKIYIDEMKQELTEHLEKYLHYPKGDFWFDLEFDVQYAKPYSSNYPSKTYEDE